MSEAPKPLKPGNQAETYASGYISIDGPGKDVIFFLDCSEHDLAIMGHASGDVPGGFQRFEKGELILMDDLKTLTGPVKCDVMQEDTILSSKEDITILIAGEHHTYGLFRIKNQGASEFNVLGKAVIIQGRN